MVIVLHEITVSIKESVDSETQFNSLGVAKGLVIISQSSTLYLC